MKSQFKFLQAVIVIFLLSLGMNASTRPSVNDPIDSDIAEGKIEAGMQNARAREYKQAQDSYSQMKLQFESIANSTDVNNGGVQKLSMLSQALYTYETELTTTRFSLLNPAQQFAFLSRLNALKTEFYSILQKTR